MLYCLNEIKRQTLLQWLFVVLHFKPKKTAKPVAKPTTAAKPKTVAKRKTAAKPKTVAKKTSAKPNKTLVSKTPIRCIPF